MDKNMQKNVYFNELNYKQYLHYFELMFKLIWLSKKLDINYK